MIQPAPLQIGDTIGIVAPARKISLEELTPAIQLFESWGLQVALGAHLFEEHHQFSGTDAQRAEDIQTFLDDPDIKAIVCARGGYGSVRAVDLVDGFSLAKHPKWLVGYSDMTVWHSHFHQVWEVATLHATMPINIKADTAEDHPAITSLKAALFGEPLQYTTAPHAFNRLGEAQAQLVGGNLSVLYSLLGSASDVDTTGKILFLEDLDEYLYHVDRMLMNLKRAGKLEHLAGLVIGGMSDMNDNTIPFGFSAEQIIQQAVAEYSYPVLFGFPAGHLDDNRALVMGASVKLHVSATEGTLTFA